MDLLCPCHWRLLVYSTKVFLLACEIKIAKSYSNFVILLCVFYTFTADILNRKTAVFFDKFFDNKFIALYKFYITNNSIYLPTGEYAMTQQALKKFKF